MRTCVKGACGAVTAGLWLAVVMPAVAVAAGSGGGVARLAPIAPVVPDAPVHAPLAVRAEALGVVLPVYARLEPIAPLEPDAGLAFAPLRVRVGRLAPTALPRYEALGGAAVAGVTLPTFGPLRVQSAALGPETAPVYGPLELKSPVHSLPVLPVYAPLGGAGAVGLIGSMIQNAPRLCAEVHS